MNAANSSSSRDSSESVPLEPEESEGDKEDLRNRIDELRRENRRLETENKQLRGLDSAHSENGLTIRGIIQSTFDRLFFSTDTPAFLVDVKREESGLSFVYMDVNPVHQEETGLDPDRVCQARPEQIFNEQTSAYVRTQYCRCVRQNERMVYRLKIEAEEEERVFRTTLLPYEEDGRVEAIFGVTESVSATREREGNRKEFRRAVEASGHGVMMTDPDGVISYVNQTFEEITGYDRDEVIGKTPSILKSGEHDEAFYRELWETIMEGDVWEGEIINRRKSGDLVYVQQTIAPVRTVRGDLRSYIAIQEDVTEQKLREQELTEKSRAIENSPIGITLTDGTEEDNPICYINDGFERLTGYSRDEAIGRNCRFLQGEETDPKTVERIRRAIDNEKSIKEEIRNYRADGEMFWNELIITPLRNEEGEVTRYLGYQQDVTQRKEAERDLRLFRRTIERSPDSIFVVNPQTAEVIDVNESAVSMLGYSRETLLGMRVHDINPTFGDEMDWSKYLEKLKRQGPLTIETEHQHRDGSQFPVEVHANFIEFDDHSRIVATARDITERKEARDKIEEQANFLRMINDQLPGVTFQFTFGPDQNGEFSYLSRGFQELVGVSSDTFETDFDAFVELVHPEDLETVQTSFESSAENKTSVQEEFRVQPSDRSEKWLQVRAVPQEHDDGSVVWTGVLIDVTENKRNMMRRQQQERRFRTLFEEAPIGLWEEDWSGAREEMNKRVPADTSDIVEYFKDHPDDFEAVTDCIKVVLPNKTVTDMTGAEDKQKLTKNFREIVTDETLASVREELHALWNGEMSHSSRSGIRRFDGEERIILRDLQLVPGQQDSWSRVFVSYRDITEAEQRKQELEETREREERFRKLAENVGGVFWQYDPGTDEYLYLSSHCQQVFGLSKETLYESPFKHIENVHPDDRKRVRKLFQDQRTEGYNESYRVEVDGEWRWVRDRAYPVMEKGKVAMVAGIAEDITEQVSRQQKLEEQIAETERISQLKTDFVARTTHDLRTPINSILGMTEMLDNSDLSTEQRDYVKTIQSTGQTMLHITNDILDLDRVESGELELLEQPFSLRDVIDEIIMLFSPWVMDEDLTLTSNIDENVPDQLIGDPNRIKQILVNLIGNAVKFTDEGWVKVAVSHVSLEENRIRLNVDVMDTGPGIPEEHQSEIFQDRTSGSPGEVLSQPGAGLGLSVCKSLVELMGGEISLESEPGEGSTFSVSMQLKRDTGEREEGTSEDDVSSITLDEVEALIVDDNHLLRRTLSAQLDQAGINVHEAKTAKEAGECLRDPEVWKDLDVVFLDRRMDKMSGTELIQELSNEQGVMDTGRMYVLTGDSEQMVDDELSGVSFAGVLQKPVSGQEIQQAVQDVLNAQVNPSSTESDDG